MKFVLIVCAGIFVNLVICIQIECEFKIDFIHDWGKRYSCRTKKFTAKSDERKIASVAGNHLKNRTNDDVTQYFARSLNIERFPSGLGESFKTIEVVRITSCNMRLVLKIDMEHLTTLKYLDLVGNKIEKLESNTFENTPGLIEVMLNNNRLQFIGSKIFEPLKALQVISLGGNPCVGSHSKHSDEQLKRLKTEINLKCNDVSITDVMIRFDTLEAKFDKLHEQLAKIFKSLSQKLISTNIESKSIKNAVE